MNSRYYLIWYKIHMEKKAYPLRFIGNGFEYFKIWIVNIILTIITLGLYSAWAKVRTNRWFYENTLLNNDPFVYHATPWQILKGRVIAVGLFILYLILSGIFPLLNLLLFVGIVLFIPFLIVSFLRFKARYSSYRGIRFDFDGGFGEAFFVYGLLPIGALFTLGLLVPYMLKRQVEFVVNHTYYGTTKASFDGTTSLYWKVFFAYTAIFLVPVLFGFFGVTMMTFGILFVYIGIAVVGVYTQVIKTNTMYNYATFGEISFQSDMKIASLFWIYVKNFILVVLTLGLYIPFAKVNIARYKAQTLILFASDLEGFVASGFENTNATGTEIVDIFDVDLGLA